MLEVLKFGGCSKLEKLPDSFGGLHNLKNLDLEECGIQRLHESLGSFNSLEKLNL